MLRLSGKLHNGEIAEYIRRMDETLESYGVPTEDRQRIRISAEEMLLDYRGSLGKDSVCKIQVKKKSGNVFVKMALPGDLYDPIKDTDSLILIKALHKWESAPTWQYKNGVNRVLFSVRLSNTMMDNLKYTWKYCKPNRGFLYLGLFTQLVSVGLLIVAPILSAKIITEITDKAIYQLAFTALALLIVNVINAGIQGVCNWAYNVLYNRTLTAIETELAGEVLRITNASLDDNGTGLFIQRMTTDTASLATAFGTFADNLAQICQYVGVFCAMLIVNPLVFIVAFTLLSLQILVETKRQREVKRSDRSFRNENERYTGIIGEMVRGAKDIKLIHAEKSFRNQMRDRIKNANDSRMYRDAQSRKYAVFEAVVREVGLFAFILILGLLLSEKKLEVASALILFNYYTLLGGTAIVLLSQIMDFITNFNLSSERLHELMSPAFPKEKFGTVSKPDIKCDIRFEDVSFSYNVRKLGVSTRFVISHMNFHINAGETVAFVGKSGSGKTTVINLISKLYEVFSGRVLIDGTDVRELDQDTLRGCMTVVTQSPYIFQMSIRDNFRVVKPDMTDEEMFLVAKQACIADDIENMPDKYDTIIGEGGVTLSGGQRQRLAIARSLLRDCRILILDEATSALDNITQDKIRQVIQNLKGSCTVVMVAHRFSTIVNADRIFYIEGGKVLDEGTHEELMEHCEDYRTLYTVEAGEQ